MYRPLESLYRGNWFKLICGASFQHLPAIHNLALAYTLAGADCIDVSADPVVVASTQEAIALAVQNWGTEAKRRGYPDVHLPWLMVSLNDGEDPHFRKAQFDPRHCPPDCPRPCEGICPTGAIQLDPGCQDRQAWHPHHPQLYSQPQDPAQASVAQSGFEPQSSSTPQGVIESRCYGCGRCLPVCPIQHITTRSYISTPAAIAPLVLQGVDAVEIHTQVGRLVDFRRLWSAIAPYTDQLKLVAISCPDGEGMVDYLWALYEQITPLPCPVIWQTDGRSMSGDIGDGTTHAAIKLGQTVLTSGPPGYVQLAGGTNRYTVTKLKTLGLINSSPHCDPDFAPAYAAQPIYAAQSDVEPHVKYHFEQLTSYDADFPLPSPRQRRHIAGIAYGSYARGLISPVLEQLEQIFQKPVAEGIQGKHLASTERLEHYPDLLWQAVDLAYTLISSLKKYPPVAPPSH